MHEKRQVVIETFWSKSLAICWCLDSFWLIQTWTRRSTAIGALEALYDCSLLIQLLLRCLISSFIFFISWSCQVRARFLIHVVWIDCYWAHEHALVAIDILAQLITCHRLWCTFFLNLCDSLVKVGAWCWINSRWWLWLLLLVEWATFIRCIVCLLCACGFLLLITVLCCAGIRWREHLSVYFFWGGWERYCFLSQASFGCAWLTFWLLFLDSW